MGLDMYLEKELYISGYSETDGGEIVDKIVNLLGVTGTYNNCCVKLPAIYWRKSNQIHKWFVENCQGGLDDCQSATVSIEKMENLYELVVKQLKNKDKIILEPLSGFFFGSTEIDEYYWMDLEKTEKELKRELDFVKSEKRKGRYWDFTYQASW